MDPATTTILEHSHVPAAWIRRLVIAKVTGAASRNIAASFVSISGKMISADARVCLQVLVKLLRD